MFATGQRVVVITDKGIAYEATVLAVAKDDNGHAAYKVALGGLGVEQLGQWHKAQDVFVQQQTIEEEQQSWDNFSKL